MKRFVTFALIGALVLGVSSMVYANVCAFDPVPAATILFPFVNFDYDAYRAGLNGTDTIFSITNVSAEAQIVHVTVWTDFSAAILDFNILLTGYDVISMKTSSILGEGQLPITLNEGHNTPPLTDELIEGVEPNGPVSAPNGAINGAWIAPRMDLPQATNQLPAGSCDSSNPSYPGKYVQKIPDNYLGLFESYLKVSQIKTREHSDACSPPPFEPSYALTPEPFWVQRDGTYPTWMYITADVVEYCNKYFPSDEEYYTFEAIAYQNVLIGDVFWVNEEERFSEASNAVHLEASNPYLANVATISPDTGQPISFYHRYAANAGTTVYDWREPLPTAWGFRYLGAGMPGVGTDVRVWKGSTNERDTIDLERDGADEFSPDALIASNCHAYTYYAWDEDEMVTTVTTVPWSQPGTSTTVIPNLIPLETQEVPVDQFDTPGAFGWMLFVWPASNYDPWDATVPAPYDYYQTWMGVKYNAYGAWSAAMDAAVMANFNCFSDQILPNLGVDYGYVDGAGYVTSPMLP